nr:hypothetical protein GOBAR_AA04103 [Ipomoea batatas]
MGKMLHRQTNLILLPDLVICWITRRDQMEIMGSKFAAFYNHKKRLLCVSVGFANHLQYNQAALTTDRTESIARNPKCETSFAIIATPNIIDSAKLAMETSVVPIRFALDAGIPDCKICAPTTSYDMCPIRDNTYPRKTKVVSAEKEIQSNRQLQQCLKVTPAISGQLLQPEDKIRET